eukprot:15187649-Ditylum_brightwellii.AAC.1
MEAQKQKGAPKKKPKQDNKRPTHTTNKAAIHQKQGDAPTRQIYIQQTSQRVENNTKHRNKTVDKREQIIHQELH